MTEPALQPQQHCEAETPRRRRFRWKWGAGILLAGVALHQLQPLLLWKLAPPGTRFGVSFLGFVWITAFLLFVWWLFFSGLRWTTRLSGACAFLFVAMSVPQVLRIDGYRGDRFPIIAFRWTPTGEQQADAYWQRSRDSTEPVSTSAGSLGGNAPETIRVTADDWPEFRGQGRNGRAASGPVRRDWDHRPPKLLWKHPVGSGWSSFAVVGNLAFTQEQRGDLECVVCYDARSGTELWNHTDPVRFSETMGGDGPRATPTFDGRHVFTLGATGILNCLQPQAGQRLWSVDILQDASLSNLQWGMAGSPLIAGDLVVIAPGAQVYGSDGTATSFIPATAVAAYDRRSGRRVWSIGDAEGAYSSPHLGRFGGESHLMFFDADGLTGRDPRSGAPLWSFAWTNTPRVNVAQPLVLGDDAVLISTGYGRGSVLLRIEQAGSTWTAKPVWESTRLRLKFGSAVLHDGYIYGLDERILVCVRDSDGRQMWRQGRYGHGQLIGVDDLLLVQSESGEVALVEASPDAYRELGRLSALEGKTWNHPVLCRGRLFVRNDREAACYDVGHE